MLEANSQRECSFSHWESDISYRNHSFPFGKLNIRALTHATRSVLKMWVLIYSLCILDNLALRSRRPKSAWKQCTWKKPYTSLTQTHDRGFKVSCRFRRKKIEKSIKMNDFRCCSPNWSPQSIWRTQACGQNGPGENFAPFFIEM